METKLKKWPFGLTKMTFVVYTSVCVCVWIFEWHKFSTQHKHYLFGCDKCQMNDAKEEEEKNVIKPEN